VTVTFGYYNYTIIIIIIIIIIKITADCVLIFVQGSVDDRSGWLQPAGTVRLRLCVVPP
jgi:phage-related holin